MTHFYINYEFIGSSAARFVEDHRAEDEAEPRAERMTVIGC